MAAAIASAAAPCRAVWAPSHSKQASHPYRCAAAFNTARARREHHPGNNRPFRVMRRLRSIRAPRVAMGCASYSPSRMRFFRHVFRRTSTTSLFRSTCDACNSPMSLGLQQMPHITTNPSAISSKLCSCARPHTCFNFCSSRSPLVTFVFLSSPSSTPGTRPLRLLRTNRLSLLLSSARQQPGVSLPLHSTSPTTSTVPAMSAPGCIAVPPRIHIPHTASPTSSPVDDTSAASLPRWCSTGPLLVHARAARSTRSIHALPYPSEMYRSSPYA